MTSVSACVPSLHLCVTINLLSAATQRLYAQLGYSIICTAVLRLELHRCGISVLHLHQSKYKHFEFQLESPSSQGHIFFLFVETLIADFASFGRDWLVHCFYYQTLLLFRNQPRARALFNPFYFFPSCDNVSWRKRGLDCNGSKSGNSYSRFHIRLLVTCLHVSMLAVTQSLSQTNNSLQMFYFLPLLLMNEKHILLVL